MFKCNLVLNDVDSDENIIETQCPASKSCKNSESFRFHFNFVPKLKPKKSFVDPSPLNLNAEDLIFSTQVTILEEEDDKK
jgi:hypothetical protein